MENKLPSLFITGTDTGVGKTFFTAGLALLYKSMGVNVCIMKPVQTGVGLDELETIEDDSYVLHKAGGCDVINCYSFAEPLSPHLAAKRNNTKISVDFIKQQFVKASQKYDAILVEGAGGFMVPLTKGYYFTNLAWDLNLPVVIVSRATLGTINHTLLTVDVARQRDLKLAGIVINRFPQKPALAEKLNPSVIEELTGLPLLGIIKEIPGWNLLGENSELLKLFSGINNEFKTIEKLQVISEEKL